MPSYYGQKALVIPKLLKHHSDHIPVFHVDCDHPLVDMEEQDPGI